MNHLFKDHFSHDSESYSNYRPKYPGELFSFLAKLCPARKTAWDCGTGNGQAAIGLAPYFSKIIATDASGEQIGKAAKHDNIEYRIARAEESFIPDNLIDLVTVAQAVHWFDQKLFFKEVNRVLKQNGILAVWTYNLLSINKDIDKIIHKFYYETINQYWPPERNHVENNYSDISFPLCPINTGSFSMSEAWEFNQLIGYLNTWSAVKVYKHKLNKEPIQLIANDLADAWGLPETKQNVSWQLTIKVWKKE